MTKTPPASVLLMEALKQQKGSGEPNRKKIGKISREQLEAIATLKMPDLNAYDMEAAVKTLPAPLVRWGSISLSEPGARVRRNPSKAGGPRRLNRKEYLHG